MENSRNFIFSIFSTSTRKVSSFLKTKIIMLEFEINIIDKKTGEVVDCYFTEGSTADSAIDEAEEYAGYDPEDYDFELV